MITDRILYDPDFIKQLKKLDLELQRRVVKTEQLFRQNILHPSLRLHRLRGKLIGYWSLTVTMDIRLIFKQNESGAIVFVSVGKHDIYKSL